MKKSILSAAIVLISWSSMAQNEAMLGKWIEQKRSFIDTLDVGRDLINAEYESYRSGQKKLDPKYVKVEEFIAPNADKINLVIWQENKSMWIAANGDLKNKFIVEPKQGKYFLKYYGTMYEILYDSEIKKLRLVNPEYKMDFYEFTTKI